MCCVGRSPRKHGPHELLSCCKQEKPARAGCGLRVKRELTLLLLSFFPLQRRVSLGASKGLVTLLQPTV